MKDDFRPLDHTGRNLKILSKNDKVFILSTQLKHDSTIGKSISEALILAVTNPQYDKRLFIDLLVQYMKTTSLEHVAYPNYFFCFCTDIQNNL